VSEISKKMAVTIKKIPINVREEKADSIEASKVKPIRAAGIEEIINLRNKESDSFSHLKSPLIKLTTSFQTKINTAKKVDKCRRAKYGTFVSMSMNDENIARCPELDTGRNSVRPCTIPNIISFTFYLLRYIFI